MIKKHTSEKTNLVSPSGIPLKAVYGPADLSNLDYLTQLGDPGEYPFTRGLYPNMYRKTPWGITQVTGFGLSQHTHQREQLLAQEGQTFFFDQQIMHIVFDLPTQLGLDSDNSMARGEVGRCGVAIDSIIDMEELFAGLPLDKLHASFITASAAAPILAMYVSLAEKRGIHRSNLAGAINNNPLVTYIGENWVAFPPRSSLRIMLDVIRFCVDEMPDMNPVTFQMYSIRERGATAVQELAFGMAASLAVCREALSQGIGIDDIAPKLVFFCSLDRNFFEEIAKLRAARRMWARIAKEEFKSKNPKSWRCRIHSNTAGSSATAEEPLNNIVRVAIEVLAGVLGGVQSIHAVSYDEALGLPSEEAVRVALRTQQIIKEEIGITDVADPLGGSYYLERLTQQLEEKAWDLIARIENEGGFISALESGWLQRELEEESYRLQAEVQSGKRIVIGVNKYAMNSQRQIPCFRTPPEAGRIAAERLRALRKKRDKRKVEQALSNLRQIAKEQGPLMPPIINAVKYYATLGEVMNVLQECLGNKR